MGDAAYILIYLLPLFTRSKASIISFCAVISLIFVERTSQHFFGLYSLHLSFDYLIKLSILIPWTFLLYKNSSRSFIIIFSACCFEVLMSIDMLLSRQTLTALYGAYPTVVFIFHLLAGFSLIGGAHGVTISDRSNRGGNSNTAKAGKGDV